MWFSPFSAVCFWKTFWMVHRRSRERQPLLGWRYYSGRKNKDSWFGTQIKQRVAGACKENNNLTFVVARLFSPGRTEQRLSQSLLLKGCWLRQKVLNQLLRLNWQENALIQWWYIAGVCICSFLILNFTHTENSNKPLKAVVFSNGILSQSCFKLFSPLLYNKDWKSYLCNFLFLYFHYYHTENKMLVSDTLFVDL